ncbi:nudix-type nucleoside diphosphatase, YffH/AdpP family [Peptoniphilus duerdenii ATCC BAA-1640]|uniref:Nudix-type nucleoside diphosphatase, YffH/AdpP family n=1 Tax=Peptoniphilus duerdenii ATCC BAA-1640 TaxID=862517 RepID=E0NMX0_9FIRM|nr:NUDIX hydrolase [Peptoniphilus duerdenii]EFM24938.1 nudix-type nucleoside diphosphatase, YffH/AdpP family [Peptoniphilus duerdenii ATCC BAA-1640]
MEIIERTIKSEKVYSGKILSVKLSTVELPDQKYSKREIVLHDNAVAVVAIHDDKILLVKQYRISVDKIIYEVPAGMIEHDENPKDAALRELEEETGYRAKNIEYLTEFYSTPGFCTEKLSIFYAKDLEFVGQNLDEGENLEVVEMPLEETMSMIESGEIMDGKTISSILFYDKFSRGK